MEKTIKECIKNSISSTKLTFFDKLVSRSKYLKSMQNCTYKCNLLAKTNNFKFNGRYPFIPILGFTEFFSALFAFLNLVTHTISFLKYKKNVKKYFIFYNGIYFVNLITWISSTLFHINDTTLTRNLDYFTALLSLILAFYFTIIRVLIVYFPSFKINSFIKNLGFFLFFYYFFHVFYLSFLDFNYELHKFVCGFFISISLLIYFCLFFKYKKMFHFFYLKIVVLGIVVGCLIEVTDTPPFFYLIDSHAIFHLITGITGHWVYKFIYLDIKYLENAD